MRAVVFTGDRELEFLEFDDPAPGPREVVIEMKASGMCGSDLKMYRAPKGGITAMLGLGELSGPVIAGHEPCGVVVAVGDAVDAREARVGDRVMDHHYDGCGVCRHCRTGWTQMCEDGAVVFGSGGDKVGVYHLPPPKR